MSVNDTILDEITGHSVDLQRLEASVKSDIRKQLKKLEKVLVADIQNSGMVDAVREQTKVKRMKALLKQTRETIKTTYKQVAKNHAKTLANVASIAETQAVASLNKAINFKVASVGMSKQMLKAIASDTLFEGAQSAEWWSRRSEAFHARFSDTIRQGMMRGDSTSTITKNLIGTSPNKFKDGALQANRRSAEALVRTSIQAVANESRLMTYADNDDIIKSIEWVSTLDSRTSQTCMGLDGLTWSNPDRKPIKHSVTFPGVTAHWGCRSTQVPITKSWEELGAKGDFNEIPESTRASMDGQVSDKIGFEGWLKGKPEAFQKDMLGAKKLDLWNKGKLKFTDLVNQSGNPLTVEQLTIKLATPKKVVKAVVPNPVLGFDKQFDDYMSDITDEAKKIINKLPKPYEVIIKRSGYYRPHKNLIDGRSGALITEKNNKTVFLHEYGHHIDYSSHKLSHRGLVMQRSMDKDFLKARAEDVKHLKEKFSGKNMFDELKLRWSGDPVMGGVSDIFDSISLGVFHDIYRMSGHGARYYNSKGKKKVANKSNQQAEVFAQMFEAWSVNGRAWKEVLEFYPNQAKAFEAAIKEVLQ